METNNKHHQTNTKIKNIYFNIKYNSNHILFLD